MALVTVNDVAVISGTIVMPKTGVWTADLVIDQPDGTGFDAGTEVDITAADGIALSGVVATDRSGDFLDAVHVRVLGGAGGMGKQAAAKNFVQPGAVVRDVLNAIADSSGETLSDDIDAGFLATNLTAWSVMANTCTWNLRALLKWLGPTFSWRILSDGTLWMGAEMWTQASGTFDILEQQPAQGSFTIGCESPFVVPGSSLPDVGNVARVEHQIGPSKIRSLISVDLAEGDRGLQGALSRIVAAQTAGFDYFAFYEATVKSQSADNKSLDVVPSDSRLAGLGSVALRHGFPGLNVQITPGAKIMVGFKSGDPRQPYVHCWAGDETAIATKISAQTLTFNNGVLAVARQTDTVTGQAGPYPLVNGQIATGNNTVKA